GMPCRRCTVTARAQTSGIGGLATPPRALFAPPQVMSRQKPVMARPAPPTSGLASLRNSATSSHGMSVLRLGDLEEPVLQPGPLDGHRLGDPPPPPPPPVHGPAP